MLILGDQCDRISAWQNDSKGAATTKLTCQGDIATEQPTEFSNNGEPQSCTRVFSSKSVVTGYPFGLAKFLENYFEVARGDSHSRIGNRQKKLVVVQPIARDRNQTTLGCKLDGIRE